MTDKIMKDKNGELNINKMLEHQVHSIETKEINFAIYIFKLDSTSKFQINLT